MIVFVSDKLRNSFSVQRTHVLHVLKSCIDKSYNTACLTCCLACLKIPVPPRQIKYKSCYQNNNPVIKKDGRSVVGTCCLHCDEYICPESWD
jgi:hypothetical protein